MKEREAVEVEGLMMERDWRALAGPGPRAIETNEKQIGCIEGDHEAENDMGGGWVGRKHERVGERAVR